MSSLNEIGSGKEVDNVKKFTDRQADWQTVCIHWTKGDQKNLVELSAQKFTYPLFDRNFGKARMSLQISWSLHIFCRVCCFAHVSHNGSGSSHVLQKCVALKWIFSKEHGPHSLSLLCWSNILKSKKEIKHKSYLVCMYQFLFCMTIWTLQCLILQLCQK